jgi:hypothetical protein
MGKMDWKLSDVTCRPGAREAACAGCGKAILAGKIWVHEVKTSWFRGDDAVDFYHEKCGYKARSKAVRAAKGE